MAAPKGNKFWELRSKHGRDKIFSTPEIMWEAACEYFQYCISNPIQDTRSFGQRTVQRPFTMQGLCRFLGCNTDYFLQFKNRLPEGEEDFSRIIKDIDDTIFQQLFEHASIGVFKENLIARKLGLTDKTDITSGGQKLEPTVIKWGDKEIKV